MDDKRFFLIGLTLIIGSLASIGASNLWVNPSYFTVMAGILLFLGAISLIY